MLFGSKTWKVTKIITHKLQKFNHCNYLVFNSDPETPVWLLSMSHRTICVYHSLMTFSCINWRTANSALTVHHCLVYLLSVMITLSAVSTPDILNPFWPLCLSWTYIVCLMLSYVCIIHNFPLFSHHPFASFKLKNKNCHNCWHTRSPWSMSEHVWT